MKKYDLCRNIEGFNPKKWSYSNIWNRYPDILLPLLNFNFQIYMFPLKCLNAKQALLDFEPKYTLRPCGKHDVIVLLFTLLLKGDPILIHHFKYLQFLIYEDKHFILREETFRHSSKNRSL